MTEVEGSGTPGGITKGGRANLEQENVASAPRAEKGLSRRGPLSPGSRGGVYGGAIDSGRPPSSPFAEGPHHARAARQMKRAAFYR